MGTPCWVLLSEVIIYDVIILNNSGIKSFSFKDKQIRRFLLEGNRHLNFPTFEEKL